MSIHFMLVFVMLVTSSSPGSVLQNCFLGVKFRSKFEVVQYIQNNFYQTLRISRNQYSTVN